MSTRWPPEGTVPLPIDVVSVQSQVIYGRVGNNVAVPTFMQMGWSVAAVPTVLLSNTPHYASLHGGPIPTDWFAGHLDDLAARGALAKLRAVQCGYLGNPAQALALAAWIERRRVETPRLRVVIDPVIGDHDHGVYVDPALVTAYREHLLPLANVLVPNDFELGHLTGQSTGDIASTVTAARSLLSQHTQWVVVTSAAPGTWPDGRIQTLLVNAERAWCIDHPFIDIVPKGTGDLFAAGLSSHWLSGDDLPEAAAKAARRVVHAMRLTRAARCAELLLPETLPDSAPGEVIVRELSR